MKAVSRTVQTLLLINVLSLVFSLPIGKASSSIYIRADGSVDPQTAPIQRDGDVYTFTDSVFEPIVVLRDNVVVDGKNYKLQGTGQERGVDLSGRKNVKVMNLEIKAFKIGIWLEYSSNNTISGNNISVDDFGILGASSNCNTISENSITNNGHDGVWLQHSSNNNISGNNITANNGRGVIIIGSSNNSISRNKVTANANRGIFLSYSSNNSVSRNDMTANGNFGVRLDGSSNNVIFGNNISNDQYDGVFLLESLNNSITRNNITASNVAGVWLDKSSNNSVSRNNIMSNEMYGIVLSEASNNLVYHNNFKYNGLQAYAYNTVNTWDDGYPSGGNYWSDYTGVDEKKSLTQDLLGSDGIGDIPYVIDENNQDRFPLASPRSLISEFDPNLDSFGFANEGFGGFGSSESVVLFSDVAEFIINDPVYRLVEVALPGSTPMMIPLVYTYLKSYHEDTLNGHCYGMSYLVARWFNHPTESPIYPEGTVRSLQLDDELHSLIDIAQQSQLLDLYTFVRWFFVTKESFSWSNLEEYRKIKNIVQTGTPIVMGIADRSNNFYHAAVVYGIESTGSIDTLYISDPDRNIETYWFDTAKDDLGINFRILATGGTDQYLLDKFIESLANSLIFWVHSPVQLHAYDSIGNHVGVNASGQVEVGFEATFLRAEDSQLMLIANPSNKYTVKLVGISSEDYNLTTYRAADNKIISAMRTGTITEGQTIEYEVTVAKDELTLQTPGLFGIPWLTWPIFDAFLVTGVGAIVVVLIIVRRRKPK